ncbi:MAG: HAMP domain-containing protein [Thermodesulfobacteriota bacterium]|jgi:methyl-accepting chemotaxis protein
MGETRRRGISLLTKLTIGILIPLVISFIVIGYIYILQIEDIKSITTKEGSRSLNDLGEKMVKQKALDVAKQMEIFIRSHPHFSKGEFYNSPALKTIAVQKVGVGKSGYTSVHDNKAISRFNKNPKVVGRNLLQLAEKLPEFRSILEASLKGRIQGSYDWNDPDGVWRRKYMFCTPIEGTDLVVAATTSIDEFSKPAKEIEQRIMNKVERTRIPFLIVMGVSLIVVILVTSIYSRTIVKPIIYLTNAADRMSLGDLDTKIEIHSSDEVGMLAESFDRMQESLKAAIERLRKKRNSG